MPAGQQKINMKLKIGIFFGGPSREREHSFTAGKMVYEHLDRSLFEPIPIFVDAQRQFILLDRSYLFHRHIRDFYPSPALAPPSAYGFQIHEESLGRLTLEESAAAAAQAGRLLRPEELPRHIDLAFLALYGLFGDDGQIQGILDHLGIPYTGNGAAAAP
jgi:UDP-N-acetylmuramate--alanine ligase